jgi:2-polyprenyl-6-methoxyphenol hydroxylase-like FAD-dependent oxidoreductase
MTESTEVLIAGAGIGGLTAALTLHAAGIQSTVVDSAQEPMNWLASRPSPP